MANNIRLSIIIPFYNEADNLPKLWDEIKSIFSEQKFLTELIFVNDGSMDESMVKLMNALRRKSAKIQTHVINLRKHFGQTAAISAGIDYAKGKVVAFLDADLQNDPHDIIQMLKELDRGFDAVIGWRKYRHDSNDRLLGSKLTNFIIRDLFNVPFHDLGCSVKVVKRIDLINIKLYSEFHRLLPVIFYWRGMHIAEVVTNHRPRHSGKSKYHLIRPLLFFDLLTLKFLNSYGNKPAYVFGGIGLLCNLIALIFFLIVTYQKFVNNIFVFRQPLFVVASFLSLIGIQLILMGLLAEILVRIYFESQQKTIYEIKEISKI